MAKVLRGYAKDNNGNLILIGTISIPHSKDKRSPENAGTKDIWSGKARRSLRKKLLANRP